MYQGDTFERWARAEKDYGDRSRFDGLMKQAGEEYNKIVMVGNKQRQLSRLASLRDQFEAERKEAG
jgi:hypothetical protein